MNASPVQIARVFVFAIVTMLVASLVLVVRFARSLVTPPNKREYPIRILGVDRVHDQIVLSDCAASRLPGRYGLWFGQDAGYLRIGDVVSARPGRVVRRLDEVVFGNPRRGQIARDSGWYFIAPWELQLQYESVEFASELGTNPAWLFHPTEPNNRGDWVIHIHGRTAERAETLRGVKVVAQHGWTSLAISYRNDSGAPRSVDRRYGLGSTESADLAAAIDFAINSGAKRIVLWGWSMGGIIALRAAATAVEQQRGVPVGLILESPALTWSSIIEHHAKLSHLPRAIGYAVSALIASKWAPALTGLAAPIAWRTLDGGNLAATFGGPLLLLHSASDDYVPVEPSRQLAADLTESVQYHEFSGAGHTRLWNFDPDRWESVIGSWLESLR